MNERTVIDPVTSVSGERGIKETYPLSLKRLSWSAVFVGASVAVGLGFLLNLFAIAIGLTTFTLGEDGAAALAIGGLIGMLIGIIVSMLAAGYTAGYLGRHYCPKRNIGIVYGFTTWTVALLLSAIVTAHVGNYIAGYTDNMVRTTNSTAKNTTASTANNALTVISTQNVKGQTATMTASPKSLALSAYIVFALFFIGAIACCFGAVWGMNCKRID